MMEIILWVIGGIILSWIIGFILIIPFGEMLGERLLVYMAVYSMWASFSSKVVVLLSVIWCVWFFSTHTFKVEIKNVNVERVEKNIH